MGVGLKAPCVLPGWEVRECVFVCAPPPPLPSYLALVSGHMYVVIILIFAQTKNSKHASVSFYRGSRASLDGGGTTRSLPRTLRPLALVAADSVQKASGPADKHGRCTTVTCSAVCCLGYADKTNACKFGIQMSSLLLKKQTTGCSRSDGSAYRNRYLFLWLELN